jgi:hypothetical protein
MLESGCEGNHTWGPLVFQLLLASDRPALFPLRTPVNAFVIAWMMEDL